MFPKSKNQSLHLENTKSREASQTKAKKIGFLGAGSSNLYRGEVIVDELIPRLVLVLQALARLALHQAAPDAPPVLGGLHPPLEPVGVVTEAVLREPAAGDGVAGALVGDDEGEEGEADKEDDEEEHDDEVEP